MMHPYKTLSTALFLSAAALFTVPAFAGVKEDVSHLQHAWERVKYQTQPEAQEREFAQLTKEADETLSRHADRAEIQIWHGIIEASYAGAKGGLGALSLVKSARRDFERAIEIDPAALNATPEDALSKERKSERRKLVRRQHVTSIAAAWIVTVPASAVLAAGLFWALDLLIG